MTTDFTPNDKVEIPNEISDFGNLLRTYRTNHGYTVQRVSKMVGLPPDKISKIELSKAELPPENTLRLWLSKLGIGPQKTNQLIKLARQFRVKHWFSLVRKEPANPDIIRLIEAYKEKELTDFDRSLLKMIAIKDKT